MALSEVLFDLNELTIAEAVLLEEVSGRGRYLEVFQALRDNTYTASDLQALALVARRREQPDATVEDVADVNISVATNG